MDAEHDPHSREQMLLMKTMEQEAEIQELRRMLALKIPKRPTSAPQPRDTSSGNTNFVNTTTFSVLAEIPPHNTPQPPPVESHSLAGHGNRLILFGGTNGSNLSNEVWIFSLVSSAAGRRGWRKKKCDGNIPLPRSGHSAVVLKNQMYIFGGFGSTLSSPNPILLNSVYVLDLDTYEWSAVVTTPIEAIKNHTMEHYKGKGYVFGGCTTNGRSNRVQVFDFETLKWLPSEAYNSQASLTDGAKTDVPTARSGHSSILHSSSMVIFGGRMSKTLYCNDVYRYNFDTKLWSRVYCGGSIPPPRAAHCAAVYKNNMIVMGGYACAGMQTLGPVAMTAAENTSHSGKKVYYDDVYVLNLASYTWYTIVLDGPMKPLGRCGHACALYEGPNAALHMLLYGGWGPCQRHTVDVDDDEGVQAGNGEESNAYVSTNAETWNLIVGVVDTATHFRKQHQKQKESNTPRKPAPPPTGSAGGSRPGTAGGRQLKEPGSTPRPWSVTTSKATTAKYFGSAPLPCPLQLSCTRSPRDIEHIVQRLGDTSRHDVVMKALESKYLAHVRTEGGEEEEEDGKMTLEEQQASVDRMYYQQVEWREDKMKQLRSKWVPEKPPRRLENHEIEEMLARITIVPEPKQYPTRMPHKISKEEADECVNRVYYHALEEHKQKAAMLDKKYRPDVPVKTVKADELETIIQRLQTPYGKKA
eukprot:PhF_6_TR8455/c0_g1_i2/m.13198